MSNSPAPRPSTEATPPDSRENWRLGVAPSAEWLEADGLGGYASGCVDGIRRRVYHAVLLAATNPPVGRLVLVNGVEAWVDVDGASIPLSSHRYPGAVHPEGFGRIQHFRRSPWPAWTFEGGEGLAIEHEIFAVHGEPVTVLTWKAKASDPTRSIKLRVRPEMTGRDYHATFRKGEGFDFDAQFPHGEQGPLVTWKPHESAPRVSALSNGTYEQAPIWFSNVRYSIETERGLDDTDDCASPGEFTFDLTGGHEAMLILAADAPEEGALLHLLSSANARPHSLLEMLRASERTRRASFPTDLDRSASAYIVRRGAGQTIIAGYPWFTDWSRDTFISMRGLCLATGRLREGWRILVEWSRHVDRGMLPNRFPDEGEELEYNSVDGSLWFVAAVHEFFRLAGDKPDDTELTSRNPELIAACDAILAGYAEGTRWRIGMDPADGLMACGEGTGAEATQLTWMDARSDGVAVTPRIGKPVEIQALWANALAFGAKHSPTHAARWANLLAKCQDSFPVKFWNEAEQCLFDVVDVNDEPGNNDGSVRPNQLFALGGGLPLALMEGHLAHRAVDTIHQRLYTPIAIRTLAPGSPGYFSQYTGNRIERDARYHQGPAWPWLIGPFVEAWVKSRGDTESIRDEARDLFLPPLLEHLETGGLGHISEIVDAEVPYALRGCPFQAWSLAELLRLKLQVLKTNKNPEREPNFRFGSQVRL